MTVVLKLGILTGEDGSRLTQRTGVFHCDHPECATTSEVLSRTWQEARNHLDRYGWTTGDDSDLCPVHSMREKR